MNAPEAEEDIELVPPSDQGPEREDRPPMSLLDPEKAHDDPC